MCMCTLGNSTLYYNIILIEGREFLLRTSLPKNSYEASLNLSDESLSRRNISVQQLARSFATQDGKTFGYFYIKISFYFYNVKSYTLTELW